MDAFHQRLTVEAVRRHDGGPFALGKAQGDILLDEIVLLRIDVQALPNNGFGGFYLLMVR